MRKTHHHLLRAISFLVAFAFCLTGTAQDKRSAAGRIVQKMLQRYETCSSYEDIGTVKTSYSGADVRAARKYTFKLYFQRPGRFRFECVDCGPQRKYVIWQNIDKAYLLLERKNPERHHDWLGRYIAERYRSLAAAIGAGADVSAGAAHTVPSLLIEDLRGMFVGVADLTDLAIVDEEAFEGVDCYVIEGRNPNSGPWQLWIDKKEFLLRKVLRRETFEDFSTVTEECHHDIRIGEHIPLETFDVKLPAGVQVKDVEVE